MSRKVLRKMKSSLLRTYGSSHPYFHRWMRFAAGKIAKFIDPMLSEHISGLKRIAAARRSATDIVGLPPVVRLMTASVRRWISGRNCANTSGLPVGSPSAGLRAGGGMMAAPALAASRDSAAIWAGVIGSASDMVGVCIAPVIAHEMITFWVLMGRASSI